MLKCNQCLSLPRYPERSTAEGKIHQVERSCSGSSGLDRKQNMATKEKEVKKERTSQKSLLSVLKDRSSRVLIDKQADECYYSMLVITNHVHEKSELL